MYKRMSMLRVSKAQLASDSICLSRVHKSAGVCLLYGQGVALLQGVHGQGARTRELAVRATFRAQQGLRTVCRAPKKYLSSARSSWRHANLPQADSAADSFAISQMTSLPKQQVLAGIRSVSLTSSNHFEDWPMSTFGVSMMGYGSPSRRPLSSRTHRIHVTRGPSSICTSVQKLTGIRIRHRMGDTRLNMTDRILSFRQASAARPR